MSKLSERWYSGRVGREVQVVRWGEMGVPLLIFPTAAGDAEECERFLMLQVLAPFLEQCRVKVYSVDSVAGQALLGETNDAKAASRAQNQFLSFVYHELVPAIRSDCRDQSIEVMAAGASIGAFNALAAVCRFPDVFSKAICMSGTYDLAKFMQGEPTRDYHESSPLHFLPSLSEGEQLQRLRQRFVLLTHGEGKWEDPDQSWRVAGVLGGKNVPNRVDSWGKEWDHDWVTWRKMLPHYLEELLPQAAPAG